MIKRNIIKHCAIVFFWQLFMHLTGKQQTGTIPIKVFQICIDVHGKGAEPTNLLDYLNIGRSYIFV